MIVFSPVQPASAYCFPAVFSLVYTYILKPWGMYTCILHLETQINVICNICTIWFPHCHLYCRCTAACVDACVFTIANQAIRLL